MTESNDGKEQGSSKATAAAKDSGGSLGKTFGLVAILSFFSKFFGLARDIVILGAFGAAADAFYFATMFTGNILVLFGGLGGPFHSTAVSILSSRKEEKDTPALAGQILVCTGLFLSLVALAVCLFAPQIVATVIPANELGDAERLALWSEIIPLVRIMSPMIVIAGLVGVGAGISNSYKEFFWPSLSPAVANIAIIAAVAGWYFTRDGGQSHSAHLWSGLMILAVGAVVGAVGQLAVQVPGILRSKPSFSGIFTMRPGMREFALMLGPAAVATTVGQINVYIDSFFVSNLEKGSITAITNANRLLQLPLGVLLTAMLVPILPRFTEQIAAGKLSEMKAELSKSMRIVWFLVIPLAAMLLSIPDPIVRLLFERGQFDEGMRYLVVTALMFLVPQAFFYIPRDLVTRAFYAQKDSTTPFLVGLAAIFVKALANYAFVVQLGLGVGGITLSTTLVTVFNMTLLAFLLRRKIGALGITRLVRPAAIMLVAASLAGLLALASQSTIENMLSGLADKRISILILALSIVISGGLSVSLYTGICILFGLEEPKLAMEKLKAMRDRRKNRA
jgi:putative peptidoglycan lipid II flippase